MQKAIDTLDLGEGFYAEIDQIQEQNWTRALAQFNDATIYQTWSYGKIRWGESNLSHLVVKQGTETVGLVQASIKRLPIISAGIAYVPWGPIWRSKQGRGDSRTILKVLRALRQEYSFRRGLLLRIAPQEIENQGASLYADLTSERYVFHSKPYRTLLIDLSKTSEELYKNTSRRWHRALKKAAAESLRVTEGDGNDAFETLGALFDQMVARKGFVPGVNFEEFKAIQKDLPEALKMKVLICEHDGKPVAALAASLIGEKGIGLLGATSTEGLNLGGFHLLNWKMMEWMKQAGARYYDFGGYDPERNPGTARFKDGLPGDIVHHIGHYEVCDNALSTLTVKGGDSFKAGIRYGRHVVNKLLTKVKAGSSESAKG
jgi:lipid II:glycine glycyltransferase (peptidoglycan interpeptide bridge formation enzyme)